MFFEFYWYVITISTLIGFFIFRLGMTSQWLYKDLIEFIGGAITLFTLIVMFYFYGLVAGIVLVAIFWFIWTPIVDIIIKKIRIPDQKTIERLSKKWSMPPEKVKESILDTMGKSDEEIVQDMLKK